MRKRIIEISKKYGLTHVGSNLGMSDVLKEIYSIKKLSDLVVLDAGHSHLAHLVAQERFENTEVNLPLHDIHCNDEDGCDLETGSLGLGIAIALGMALSNRDRDVYCVLSDGGCAEGSVWEALRIKEDLKIGNLKVYVNANGYSAYDSVDLGKLEKRLKAFCSDIVFVRTNSDFKGGVGVHAHYKKIT